MQTIFDVLRPSYEIESWLRLIDNMRKMGLASILVIILAPITAGIATIGATPAAFITMTGLFITILKNAMPAHDEL